MRRALQFELERLRVDFTEVTGKPFSYFFCPILFIDEDTSLCRAHIVNKVFGSSSRRWTVQRSDVDNFYGRKFESSFTRIQFMRQISDGILNEDIMKSLKPKLIIDGEQVEYFKLSGQAPRGTTPVNFEFEKGLGLYALKCNPKKLLYESISEVSLSYQQDLRLPAYVSILKAAHLTMFSILKYRYSLSHGGVFIGHILGQFYQLAKNVSDELFISKALEYFSKYSMLVRPVLDAPPALGGSIDDCRFRLCFTSELNQKPWAILVFVRTNDRLHAAIIPILEDSDAFVSFYQFIISKEASFYSRPVRYVDDHWQISKANHITMWPKADLGYDLEGET